MRISHRHKFVFFANPKTASRSVRELLDPISDLSGINYFATTPDFPFYAHMRPIEARDAFAAKGWNFEGYYRFTFVRKPWARAVSLYRMISRVAPQFDTCFADWLAASSVDGAGGGGRDVERWRKYGTYSLPHFAGDENGRLLVNDVFRMEDVDHLPTRLRERGIPVDQDAIIPRLNVTGEGPSLSDFYDDRSRDIIATRYAEEIAQFGYRFEDL